MHTSIDCSILDVVAVARCVVTFGDVSRCDVVVIGFQWMHVSSELKCIMHVASNFDVLCASCVFVNHN